MTRPAHVALVLAALLASAGSSHAQTVYRCGPDGRTYSQWPCSEGRAIPVADPRDAAEQREGEAAAAQHARTAELLRRDRERREQTVVRAGSMGDSPTIGGLLPSTDRASGEKASRRRSSGGKRAGGNAAKRAEAARDAVGRTGSKAKRAGRAS